ncbi:MAG: hypothetical protein WCW01_05275 [Gammaproteobacteria bacterium]
MVQRPKENLEASLQKIRALGEERAEKMRQAGQEPPTSLGQQLNESQQKWIRTPTAPPTRLEPPANPETKGVPTYNANAQENLQVSPMGARASLGVDDWEMVGQASNPSTSATKGASAPQSGATGPTATPIPTALPTSSSGSESVSAPKSLASSSSSLSPAEKPTLPLAKVPNVIPKNVKSFTLTGGRTNPIVLSSAVPIQEVVDPTTRPSSNSNKGLEDYIRSHGVYLCDSNGNVVKTIHDPLQPSDPKASENIDSALKSLSKNESIQNYLHNFINTDQNGLLWAARAREADELQKRRMELGVTQVGSKVPGYETKVYFIPNSDGSLDVRVTNVVNRIASYGFKMDNNGNPIDADGRIVDSNTKAARDIDIQNPNGLLAYDTTYRLSPIENGAKVKAEVISTTEAVLDQRVEQYLPHLKSQSNFDSRLRGLSTANVLQNINQLDSDITGYMNTFLRQKDWFRAGEAAQRQIGLARIPDLTQKISNAKDFADPDARAKLLQERDALKNALEADEKSLKDEKANTADRGYLKSLIALERPLLRALDQFLKLTEPAVAATSAAAVTQATTPPAKSPPAEKAQALDPIKLSIDEIEKSLRDAVKSPKAANKEDYKYALKEQAAILNAVKNLAAKPGDVSAQKNLGLVISGLELKHGKALEEKLTKTHKPLNPGEILLQNLQDFLKVISNQSETKAAAPTAVAAHNTVAPSASQTTTTKPEPAIPKELQNLLEQGKRAAELGAERNARFEQSLSKAEATGGVMQSWGKNGQEMLAAKKSEVTASEGKAVETSQERPSSHGLTS